MKSFMPVPPNIIGIKLSAQAVGGGVGKAKLIM